MSVFLPLGLSRFLREVSSHLLPGASCEGLASTLLEPEQEKRGWLGDRFIIQMYIHLNPPVNRILLSLSVLVVS